MFKVTADFETQSAFDLRKGGAWEYSVHPTTRPTAFGFKHQKGRPFLFDFYQINRKWADQPIDFRSQWTYWIKDADVVFSAHNAFFEQCIYNNILVLRYGWPSMPISKWRCSAAKAAACAIPRNLADSGAVMETATQKDYEGHRIMLKLCKPTKQYKAWADARAEIAAGKRVGPKKLALAAAPAPAMFWTPETAPADFAGQDRYCVTDVLAEEQLDDALPDLPPFEQRVWELDQKINLRGIAVDMPLVNRIVEIMEAEAKTMNKALDVLTMGLVQSGNQRDAILDYLTIEGIELPDLKAKTVDDFLKNGKMSGDAEALLKIRRALSKSSTAKYKTFQLRAKSDGRVRDMLLYSAASTHRWGGKGVQPQNFPRGVIKNIFEAIHRIKTCSVDELKMLYGQNLMPLFSSVLRGMFVASPGKTMFVEDYSAVECRVTWWLAGHEAGLQMFRDGMDPYKAMAALIFNKPIWEVTDDERQVGKAAVLGCGYQMGGKKFVAAAWGVYRAKVTLDLAKVSVTKYREQHWPVAEMWGQYEAAAIAAVEAPKDRYQVGRVAFYMEGRFLCICPPSGFPLRYFDPQVGFSWVYAYTNKEGVKEYTGSLDVLKTATDLGGRYDSKFQAKKLSFMGTNHKAKAADCIIPKWTRETTYGGKLVENVVQKVSRDILAFAMVNAEAAGFEVLMHSHDESVAEAEVADFEGCSGPGELGGEYRKIMETLPKWADGLPLKASGWHGDRYKKG